MFKTIYLFCGSLLLSSARVYACISWTWAYDFILCNSVSYLLFRKKPTKKLLSHGAREEPHTGQGPLQPVVPFHGTFPALQLMQLCFSLIPKPNSKFRLSLRHCLCCSRVRSNINFPGVVPYVFWKFS